MTYEDWKIKENILPPEFERQISREKYKHAFEVSKQQREDAQEMYKVQDYNRPKL